MRQTYFLFGEELGSRPAPLILLHHGCHTLPLSYVLICGECGREWARVEVEGSKWSAAVVTCPLHSSEGLREPAGSLLIPGLPFNGKDLPLALLKHEFLMALNALEKQYER